MLNTLSKPSVMLLKISSGEEIIAYVNSVDSGYRVQRPLMVVMSPSVEHPGQAQISFCPWLMCADARTMDILIPTSQVMVITKPNANSVNSYISSVGEIDG